MRNALPRVTPFVSAGLYANKVMCPICGRTGYGLRDPRPGEAAPWQRPCLYDPEHSHKCVCGKRYPSRGSLAAHINAMGRHHPNELHTRAGVRT